MQVSITSLVCRAFHGGVCFFIRVFERVFIPAIVQASRATIRTQRLLYVVCIGAFIDLSLGDHLRCGVPTSLARNVCLFLSMVRTGFVCLIRTYDSSLRGA